MMTETKSDRLYIRMSPEEKQQLEQIAKEEMRSMSNVARLAIQEFIQSRQEGRK
jgi:predicted transcriptional regulator